MTVYEQLKKEILEDPILGTCPKEARAWMEEMLDYTVVGGKMNRGLAVLEALKAIKGDVDEKEAFLANVVGWCIELLQAFFLVEDDIMDGSITRRGRPCWYKNEKVGMIAINDGIILEACIYNILKRHFRDHASYVALLELFHDTTFQTAHGQLLDLLYAPIGQRDLTKYTMDTYLRIVTYKTAYYTIYMPIASGMVLAGMTEDSKLQVAQKICVKMGQYFQIQDDYLDCFADPEVLGKIGTDIEDSKCSWLVVKALEKANAKQKKVIKDNYGLHDPAKVQKIKDLYREMKLEEMFRAYEEDAHKELSKEIREQKEVPEHCFNWMLNKIFKRKN